jgi:hypothetical protein
LSVMLMNLTPDSGSIPTSPRWISRISLGANPKPSVRKASR